MSNGTQTNAAVTPPESSLEARSRRWLTFFVVLVSVLGVVGLGLAALLAKSSTEPLFDRIKYVSATILPLLASWVGTILAFYFSKENLAAATQSVTELSKTLSSLDKLKSFPVSQKMRPFSAITFEQIDAGNEDKENLIALLKKFARFERIIILDSHNVVRLLVYRSIVERYISQVATGASAPASGHNLDQLTLKDLITSSADMQQLITGSFGFVAQSATLADAKQVMDKIRNCGDVFVTQTGQPTEPLLGWVTDNLIAENSTV